LVNKIDQIKDEKMKNYNKKSQIKSFASIGKAFAKAATALIFINLEHRLVWLGLYIETWLLKSAKNLQKGQGATEIHLGTKN